MSQPENVTVKDALSKGTEFLKKLGIESARLEIELIIAHSIGLDRLGLYMNLDRILTPEERDISRELLKRRRLREPLAYILGEREFYGFAFKLSNDVLIPRPETELLVDHLLADLKKRYPPPPKPQPKESTDGEEPVEQETIDLDEGESDEPMDSGVLIDMGTGSGAIAVACAAMMRKRGHPGRWIATDVSAEALEIARANAVTHELEDSIEFREGAFFEPLDDMKRDVRPADEPVIALCANPPYVAEGEREKLQPEVAEWEPSGALFSGHEGLDHLTRIIREAPEYLGTGGLLLLEIGYDQGEAVRELIRDTEAFEKIAIHADLAGHPRLAQATRL